MPPPGGFPPRPGGPRAGGPPPPRRPGGYPPGPPDRSGGGGFLKVIAIAAVVVVVLAAAGAALLFVAGPSDLIKDQLVARVKSETGRDLVISGPTSFTFYPSLGVAMQNVSLSAPPGMTAPPLLTIKSLTVSVGLLPLLNREVTVERLLLDEPVLSLQIDESGRRTWDFAAWAAGDGTPIRLAQAASPPGSPRTDAPPLGAEAPQPPRSQAIKLDKLSLGDVRIERGTLIYVDQRAALLETVSGINLRFAVPDLSSPANFSGNLRWRGETLDVNAEITTIAQLVQKTPAKLVAKVSGRPFDADYSGSIAFGDSLDAEGDLDLKSPSLTSLAAFAAGREAEAAGGAPVSVRGKLRASSNTYTLSGASALIDKTKGSGDIAITTGGTRPIVKANLKFAELDLNAILDTEHQAAAPPKPAKSTSPTSSPGAAPPQSIEDLLKNGPETAPGTQVRGYTKRSGWSDEPYDFTPLGLVDVDARLNVGRLIYREIKVGQSVISVVLQNRVLKTDFTDVQFYGGRGKGLVAIDASDPKLPKIVTNLNVDGVDGLAMLKDAADLDWLAGKGKIALGVTGQGKTQRALVNSLGGSADLSFTDGAIVGINIPGMLRNAAQGKLGGLKSAPTEKTDFSQLSSSWAINRGVARNSDLKLIGPLIRVTGEGAVKLGERALDYTLKPKLVADTTGQGGNMALAGIEVPLRITGPWEKPKFAPDLKGILSDPNQAVETIKEIGKQFKGKNADEILDGLLGGGGTSEPSQAVPADGEAAPAPKRSKTEQLLEQFLKTR